MALPFAIGMILYVINPEYLMPLFTDPIGQKMLVGAAIMMILGGIVMKKMIAIKV